MTDNTLISRIAQEFLAPLGLYSGIIDGDWGNMSKAAARAWFTGYRQTITNSVTPARRSLVAQTPSNDTLRLLAAQIHLRNLRLYNGKIDAIWGTLSKDAAIGFLSTLPITGTVVPNFLSPYDVARGLIGTKEIPGKNHNGTIVKWLRAIETWVNDDETAWCSAFVNHCAREAGYEQSDNLAARSWLKFGDEVDIGKARQGDVVIFWRGSPSAWTGHVGFVDSLTASSVRTLGGNQNNEVNITSYARSMVLGIRRLRTLDRLQGSTSRTL